MEGIIIKQNNQFYLIVFLLFIIILFSAYTAVRISKLNDTAAVPDNPEPLAEKTIEISPICQYPTLPTGCEAVAAVTVLKYYNESISAEEFAQGWLQCNNNFYYSNGRLFGPNPNEFFVGDPFSKSSYGCYAAPIASAINKNSNNCRAEIIENISLLEICKEYTDKGKPVLIWATTSMKPSEEGTQWHLDDGSLFTWVGGEHCFVLVGYDEKHYFLIDPQSGSIIGYQKDIVSKRFEELGAQAILIEEKT